MKFIKNINRFCNRVKFEILYKEFEQNNNELGKRWARLQWFKNREI